MDAAILTVGDELLAGDVENTNATWLATQLTERGVGVREMRVVPDDATAIATAVREVTDRFDATIVTGGLGSTPDDVTLEGVATAVDVDLKPNAGARSDIEPAVDAIREEYPGFEFDFEAAVRYPARGRLIPNDEGIVPGWVVETVYVLPGMPAEMKDTFDSIADEFAGDSRTRTMYSTEPESHLNDLLEAVHERFDVAVGCYPGAKRRRIKLSATDADQLERAAVWLADRPEIDETE